MTERNKAEESAEGFEDERREGAAEERATERTAERAAERTAERKELRFSLRPALPGEEGVLAALDRECFPEEPWSEEMFRRDLEENPFALILLAETEEPGVDAGQPESADRSDERPESASPIMGYAGVWFVGDEGHITNVAVRPAYRGRGLARTLLQVLERMARQRKTTGLTLEVRPSNAAAIALYEGCGFRQEGRRPRYYENNGEDALILWKHFED